MRAFESGCVLGLAWKARPYRFEGIAQIRSDLVIDPAPGVNLATLLPFGFRAYPFALLRTLGVKNPPAVWTILP
jgi:hypothetical protein